VRETSSDTHLESCAGDEWNGYELKFAFFDDPYREYPPQERQLSSEIPAELRRIHAEARTCLRANANTAAVVMAGRALEGVCDLNGVTGGTLQAKLVQMKERGLIDGRLWEWAETLRAVRNAAAHFTMTSSISRQDAEDTVAFTEALLDYMYVLTARFNAFKERRATQANSDRGNSSGDQPNDA
jgi:hypothetical protein